MTAITFLSDFGLEDPYVASVKARLLGLVPEATIVDISHKVDQFDIAHGAYLLATNYMEFPLGTVHIVAIDSHSKGNGGFVAMEMDGHFFVAPNNGILSMLSEKEPEQIVDLPTDDLEHATFPAKSVLAPAAARLASGDKPDRLGKPCSNFVRLIGRQVKATKSIIAGHVIRVDNYGNLITNIKQEVFVKLRGDRSFIVSFGRESGSTIHKSYAAPEEGDCFMVFNCQGNLEIGINKGNAGELLGLEVDSPISIKFQEI